MGEKWTNPPVFYVLAQIRFNPIAQMEEYVPALQDRLRRAGFPDYQLEQKIEVAIRKPESDAPDIRPQKLVRWSFTNIEKTEGYVLHSDALIFHTTAYVNFEDFSKKALKGLELAHEVIELAFTQRVGLRYLDAVAPSENDSLTEYLTPSLLGLSISVPGQLKHSFSETVSDVNGGTLVARTVITDGGLAIPPDLFPMSLTLSQRISELSGRMATLDTDYFVEQRRAFDVDGVGAQLVESQTIVSDSFKASITSHAADAWK